MIQPRHLADGLEVTGQLHPSDLPQLAERFRTIINNRPDGEAPGQPTSAEIEAAARPLGLDYVHIPVVGGQVSEEQVSAFASALARKPGPILAFCGSGRRAAMLWALSQAGKRSPMDLIAAAAQAGYDLAPLEPTLRERAEPK